MSYTTDGYTQALCQLIEEIQADIVLMGHTSIGKDLAPRTAARLDAGLVSDCTAVSVEDGEVVFTRPIYSGKAFQEKVFNEGIVFATLRANNFEIARKERAIRDHFLSSSDQRFKNRDKGYCSKDYKQCRPERS